MNNSLLAPLISRKGPC